jgi:monoamine oxidase
MQVQALRDVPTWMAGHAKIVAIYDRPHWRDAGFSGDAISQKGPLAELHDASSGPDGPYAIFGFVGLPAAIRQGHRTEILDRARAQLSGLFGEEMSNPVEIHMEDWSQNPLTATQADAVAPQHHPAYGMPSALRGLFNDRVIFASSEMGRQFGGFLEGALEAAEAAAHWLQNRQDD